MGDIMVRRKSDGKVLVRAGGVTGWVDRPRLGDKCYVRSITAAHTIIRVDLGLDLAEVDFIPRDDLAGDR